MFDSMVCSSLLHPDVNNDLSVPAFGFSNILPLTPNYTDFEVSVCTDLTSTVTGHKVESSRGMNLSVEKIGKREDSGGREGGREGVEMREEGEGGREGGRERERERVEMREEGERKEGRKGREGGGEGRKEGR